MIFGIILNISSTVAIIAQWFSLFKAAKMEEQQLTKGKQGRERNVCLCRQKLTPSWLSDFHLRTCQGYICVTLVWKNTTCCLMVVLIGWLALQVQHSFIVSNSAKFILVHSIIVWLCCAETAARLSKKSWCLHVIDGNTRKAGIERR